MFLTPTSAAKRAHSEISEQDQTPKKGSVSTKSSTLAQRVLSKSTTTTPLSSPTKAIPSTPTRQITTSDTYRICPPIVKGQKKPKIEKDQSFLNPLPIIAGAPLENLGIPDGLTLKARTTLTYLDGTISRNVCKQHSQTDCGSTAFLMILTDIVRQTGKSLPITSEFWKWYASCELAHANDIVEKAKTTTGVGLSIHRVPESKPLDFLKSLLEKSNHSVISAITHPTLAGHWIVIDKITSTHTQIRDPNTGIAFSIPNEIMETYYQDDIEEYALSVSRLETNSS